MIIKNNSLGSFMKVCIILQVKIIISTHACMHADLSDNEFYSLLGEHYLEELEDQLDPTSHHEQQEEPAPPKKKTTLKIGIYL